MPREKKELREKLLSMAEGIPVAIVHESPFRIKDLTACLLDVLPDTEMAVCCDLTKLHEKTLYGRPGTILDALQANEKAEKGEYCLVLDFRNCPKREAEPAVTGSLSLESLLVETMLKGKSLREAQEKAVSEGHRKNAVKQAALHLKNLFLQESASEMQKY